MNIELYNAACSGALWRDLSHFGRFVFRGKDAAALLHHLTTADVKKLKSNSGTDAALITSKGRLIDLLSVFRFTDNSFFVVASPNRREILAPHARKFILYKQEVEIEDVSPRGAMLGIFGAQAARVLAQLGAPSEDDFSHGATRSFSFENADIFLAKTSRLPRGGFLLNCENREVLQQLARESQSPF